MKLAMDIKDTYKCFFLNKNYQKNLYTSFLIFQRSCLSVFLWFQKGLIIPVFLQCSHGSVCVYLFSRLNCRTCSEVWEPVLHGQFSSVEQLVYMCMQSAASRMQVEDDGLLVASQCIFNFRVSIFLIDIHSDFDILNKEYANVVSSMSYRTTCRSVLQT